MWFGWLWGNSATPKTRQLVGLVVVWARAKTHNNNSCCSPKRPRQGNLPGVPATRARIDTETKYY